MSEQGEVDPRKESKQLLLTPDGLRKAAAELRESSAKSSPVSLKTAETVFVGAQLVVVAEAVGAGVMLAVDPSVSSQVGKAALATVGLLNAELPFFRQALEESNKKPLQYSTHVGPWLAERMERVAGAIEKVQEKRSK